VRRDTVLTNSQLLARNTLPILEEGEEETMKLLLGELNLTTKDIVDGIKAADGMGSGRYQARKKKGKV